MRKCTHSWRNVHTGRMDGWTWTGGLEDWRTSGCMGKWVIGRMDGWVVLRADHVYLKSAAPITFATFRTLYRNCCHTLNTHIFLFSTRLFFLAAFLLFYGFTRKVVGLFRGVRQCFVERKNNNKLLLALFLCTLDRPPRRGIFFGHSLSGSRDFP